MKWNNFHWVYILAIGTIVFLLPKIKSSFQQFEECYGIAENQIRNYNRPDDVVIHEIRVRLGQEVQVGDTLMVFYPQNLQYKKEDLSSQTRLLDINKKVDRFQIQQAIQRLEHQKSTIEGNYNLKVRLLQDKKRTTDSLALLITNLPVSAHKYDMEKNTMDASRQLDLGEVNQRILLLMKELNAAPDLTIEKKSNIKVELSRIAEKEKGLVLISDMAGIVGQLDVQPGDAISAYQSLIKLYSTHPSLVTTYISENYIGSIDLIDSVIIESLTGYRLKCKILNLGARVTALPDRLKKIPEIKSWGREVQIEIPIENKLIQGEKVKVIFPGLSTNKR